MAYVPPSSFYDIFPNDFQHWNFAAPAANLVGGAPVDTPRYGLQNPGGGVPAPVRTTTPAEAPAFQVPTLVEETSSTDSSSEAQTPPSSQLTSPDPSAPSSGVISFQDLTQLSEIQGFSVTATAADAPTTTKRRTKKNGGPRRRRGPNKRCKGSGYADLMQKLPLMVQYALEQEYPDCCEIVRGKDPSTVQKHRLAKRHFNKIDPELQSLLPAFTCPAFVGMHPQCRSAKAGRYDSTERHCNSCPGFQELQAAYKNGILFPFVVSKKEFDGIQRYRKTVKPGDNFSDAPDAVVVPLRRLYKLLMPPKKGKGEKGATSSESQPDTDSQFAAEEIEVLSPAPSLLPMDPSSSAQPQQLFQFLPEDPLYDFAPVNDAQQVAAVPSLIDPFGGFNPFAAGPGVLFGTPPYGLYPANPPTWPNVAFDPTAFGPLFN